MSVFSENLSWRTTGYTLFLVCLMGIFVLTKLPETIWEMVIESQSRSGSYQTSPTELQKLIFIIDQYKKADLKVIYNGRRYESVWGWGYAREFLAQNYNGMEDAESWIRRNTYKTSEGEIIYFEYPDKTRRSMRDIFLEDLMLLEKDARSS